MPQIITLRLDAASGARLDAALAAAVAGLSRTRAQGLIRDGAVVGDGGPLGDPAHKIGPDGLSITVTIPDPAAAGPEPEAIPLDIVYEDSDLIVIDKPAGMVVHPSAGHEHGTLVHALLHHCAGSLSGVGGVMRPGIVHRLDKDTSGLLVAAKNDRAHRGLAAQFADHGREGALERRYDALAWGALEAASRTIDAPIGRHPHDRERMSVTRAGKGRFAITHLRTVESFCGSQGAAAAASWLHCALETGRTHQIRVHLAHAGHPLLGDPVYGPGFRTKAAKLGTEARAALEALNRQALHAGLLGFEHPATGARLSFERRPPADFLRLSEALRGARRVWRDVQD